MVFWNHLYPLPVTVWLSFPMINVLERWHLRWVFPMFYLKERPHNRQWVWGCTKVMDKSLYLETYSSIWLSFMLSHSLVTGKIYEHHLVFFLRGHAMRSKPTQAVDGLPWGTQAYFHCILEDQNQPMATAGMGFRGKSLRCWGNIALIAKVYCSPDSCPSPPFSPSFPPTPFLPFLIKGILFLYVCYVCGMGYVHIHVSSHWGQRRVLDLWYKDYKLLSPRSTFKAWALSIKSRSPCSQGKHFVNWVIFSSPLLSSYKSNRTSPWDVSSHAGPPRKAKDFREHEGALSIKPGNRFKKSCPTPHI